MTTDTLVHHTATDSRHWSDEEYAVRLDLSRAYQLAAQLKFTDHIYTHFSVRVPGKEEHFLINPYGLLFGEITPHNLIKIDIRGNIIDDPTGLGINQAGYVIHAAIHEARPDLKAILHTHTRDGVAVSAQREGLLPISQHALGFYSRITYHDYEGIALDMDEQQRLVRDLADSDVMILRNHGLLAAGSNIAQAFRNLHMLERACNIQIAALAGGRQNILLAPQEAIDKVSEQSSRFRDGNDPVTLKHWQALVRTLPAEISG
ncbi:MULTISPECIES: class II aldolase/adducin family protein [unclassified Tatumella]|uniref:class II aldolase/adducin family protein n=1 Tax=unclassified Tatumella TaxID=2649542 RepID=UPI001BAF6DFE|nr:MULTISPECIES: class II aldolase/adducin family protein [unclassified Tatumella]MBS0876751.1 class II aldolase/adducin family protein [Tatumella sp. JGM82]MBS0889824.1 class II aldolase/adducin family protein [Tatumella sp. JGM94]MBS0901506.1 class II aldolase/adducin family protein [Tatumella sp. JGM100]